jgi:hypothetical protein
MNIYGRYPAGLLSTVSSYPAERVLAFPSAPVKVSYHFYGILYQALTAW